MDHFTERKTLLPNRFGLHYIPDFEHYSDRDANFWLPKLKDLDAGWLVLQAPSNRAIPQNFIEQMVSSGINIILDLNLPLDSSEFPPDLPLLLPLYAKWGVRYIVPFWFANLKASWSAQNWSDPKLIDHFSRIFNQFAQLCYASGIKAIFSPLMPGGDYWDLAFLKNFLKHYQKNASPELFNELVLSSVAWDWGKSLDWGQGGKNAWPKAKPYLVSPNIQNQVGFRTFEWYAQAAFEATGKKFPMILFQAGISHLVNSRSGPEVNINSSIENTIAIYRLAKGQNIFPSDSDQNIVNPVGSEIIACLFYNLSAGLNQARSCEWFDKSGQKMPIAQAITVINAENNPAKLKEKKINSDIFFKHKRYILIDTELRKHTHKFLELLRPYINKFQPLIGFSKDEAMSSAVVLAVTKNKDGWPIHLDLTNQYKGLLKVIQPGEIQSYIQEIVHD